VVAAALVTTPKQVTARFARTVALADQALSGLSNFLAVAFIARSATPEAFGHFTIVYALFITFLGLARRWWGTRLSMTQSPDESLTELRRQLAATVLVTPVAGCVMALPSLALTQGRALSTVVVLAVALPVVVAQDLCRYAAVAAKRPLVAAASDLVWVVVVAAGYAFRPPLSAALTVWLGGAVLALLVALVALRLLPAWGHGWSALRERNSVSEVSGLTTIGSSLVSYAILGLATLSLDAAAAGTLRGAATVMAPVNTAIAFVGLAVLPIAFRTPPSGQFRLLVRTSAFLAAVSAGWGGILLVLPRPAGELLLGASWDGARSVLPWTTLEYAALTVGVAVMLGLQAQKQARRMAVLWGVSALLATVAAVVAAWVGTSVITFARALAMAALGEAATAAFVYYRYARRVAPRNG
jgi:O-antigen/teichoic acid export membrane protein